MPYDPGISYRGDQYLYKGLESLGQGIGALGSDIGEQIRKEADEKRKQQQEQITNDAIMQHARQQGRVTPEEFDKYQSASWKQKNAIAHGHIFNMAQDMKEQMADMKRQAQLHQIDAATARAELAQVKAQIVSGPPQTAMAPDPSGGPGFPVMRTPSGWEPLKSKEQEETKPIKSPYTGQPLGVEGTQGGPHLYSKETMQELAKQRKSIKDNILARDEHKWPWQKPSDHVTVFKNGVAGTIPRDQLDKAIEEGYR